MNQATSFPGTPAGPAGRKGIQPLYDLIFRIWRRRRWDLFERTIAPQPGEVILDLGGIPDQWISRTGNVKRVDCVNLCKFEWEPGPDTGQRITFRVGDGCNLDLADQSYDILYSNSVIEHVGDWDKQQQFAREAQRVARRLWVQTPALECPVEPHYLAPMVHWLPVVVRRRVLRWFTPWGWIEKPDQAKIDRTIDTTRLLSRRQFQSLFPDCNIMTERLFGVFPKSYIAWRR